jgi:hypothetical protein
MWQVHMKKAFFIGILAFHCDEARGTTNLYFQNFVSTQRPVISFVFSVTDLSPTDLLTDPILQGLGGTIVEQTIGAVDYYAVKLQKEELLVENSHDFNSLFKYETIGLALELVTINSPSDLPQSRTNTVVVAKDLSDELHFLIFDEFGRLAINKGERQFANLNAKDLNSFRKYLDQNWDSEYMLKEQKQMLINAVIAITGHHTFAGSGHVYGLVTNVFWILNRTSREIIIDHDKGSLHEGAWEFLLNENTLRGHSFFVRTALKFGLPPGRDQPNWKSPTEFSYRQSPRHVVTGTIGPGVFGKPDYCLYEVWVVQNGVSNIQQRARIDYLYEKDVPYPREFTIDREAFSPTTNLNYKTVYRILDLNEPHDEFDSAAFSVNPYIMANSEVIRVREIRNAKSMELLRHGVWGDIQRPSRPLVVIALVGALIMLPIIFVWRVVHQRYFGHNKPESD